MIIKKTLTYIPQIAFDILRNTARECKNSENDYSRVVLNCSVSPDTIIAYLL